METVQTIQESDIMFLHDVHVACSEQYSDYNVHIFLLQGDMSFNINGKEYHATQNDGVILVKTKMVKDMQVSDDFSAIIMLLSNHYLETNTPIISMQVKVLTYYYQCPMLTMDDREKLCFRADMDNILYRLEQKQHIFYMKTLKGAINNFMFDLINIYSRCHSKMVVQSRQAAKLTYKFIDLLQQHVASNRKVEFYADKLCISPKYLSLVCLEATGQNPSYWISRFLLVRISEELADSDKSITDISNEYNFKALSHFTRYIKSNTGMTPTEFWNRNGISS